MIIKPIRRVAMLSVHTSPLATLGGKKTGGMNVYIRALSRELSRRGIAVDVYTRRNAPDLPQTDHIATNAQVIYIPAGPEYHLSTTDHYAHLDTFLEETKSSAAKNKLNYDIIFSHYWLSGWVAHELRGEWCAPVVQMFHTLGRMKNRIAQTPKDREADIRIFSETDIMSWADHIIAATPAEQAQLLWLYRADRQKISIVPPGVDLERFYPLEPDEAKAHIGVPAHKRMLLFVGRIEPLKGVDTILHAAALLRQSHSELTSNLLINVIGGDAEEEPPDTEMGRLRALRDKLGLHDIVRFLGAHDQDSLQYYYSAAEALIMPSDYESFGMVALEAMACGTPVIASEVGGLAFLVRNGETGFHVPTREPDALADRIRLLLTDSHRREKMGRTAQQTAQDYSWCLIAGRLLRVFVHAKQKHAGQNITTRIFPAPCLSE
ncbi:MAG: glycosyltransferase [Anaerolineae bacterium]|nr:glycosyltransferase [Anaerolineae bacterium]